MMKFAYLLFPCFLGISTLGFSHAGKHPTVKLPPFEENRLQGKASLRLTKVNEHYIVAFSSPQYNFLGTDNDDLTAAKLAGERATLLKNLENPGFLFDAESLGCASSMVPHVVLDKSFRITDPSMSKKEVKNAEHRKHATPYAKLTAQYKLKCKKAITKDNLKTLRLFDNAKELQELVVTVSDGSASGKGTEFRVRRSDFPKKDPGLKAPAAVQGSVAKEKNPAKAGPPKPEKPDPGAQKTAK